MGSNLPHIFIMGSDLSLLLPNFNTMMLRWGRHGETMWLLIFLHAFAQLCLHMQVEDTVQDTAISSHV